MADERTYIRFPNVDIERNAEIQSAVVRFTAYEYRSGNFSVDCYFEVSDNTTAPSSKNELTSLPLTGGTTWDINDAWVEGETYDSPDVGDILQDIISQDGWQSGGAITFVMDNSSSSDYRKFCAEEYIEGNYKAELIISSKEPIRTPTPIISPESGTYEGIQDITITCSLSASEIYYTDDGDVPDNTDILYTSSFALPEGTYEIQAIAYSSEPGYSESLIRTNNYIIIVTTLWAWGSNSHGQLGLEDTIDRSSPVQVGDLTDWSQISHGHIGTLAIKTDGTLWGWGDNQHGQLGLGDITNRSSPVQVGNLTDWVQVSCGSYHTIAVKTDGTLWAWGYNKDGQLGLGDITHRSSPVQVGNLTDWSEVSGGGYYTIAIKTDRTLWSWGRNKWTGYLGLGDTIDRSSPVQVGNLTNWLEVSCGGSHTMAIKTDGTLWSWGLNRFNGELGLGDTTDRSSPVQVGNLTDWSQISCNGNHTVTIKDDKTLWSWGKNDYGQLGLGDTTDRSSPVQVGNLTDWSQISCGYRHTTAIKDDETLWSWGRNDDGQLGHSELAQSPVQVGSLTDWSEVFCGGNHTTACK